MTNDEGLGAALFDPHPEPGEFQILQVVAGASSLGVDRELAWRTGRVRPLCARRRFSGWLAFAEPFDTADFIARLTVLSHRPEGVLETIGGAPSARSTEENLPSEGRPFGNVRRDIASLGVFAETSRGRGEREV
jgi:hypothetical protein